MEQSAHVSPYMISIKDQYHVPDEFFKIYSKLNNEDTDIKIGNFIVYSPNEVKKHMDYYQIYGITPGFIDVGMVYHGMGHYAVLSYDPHLNKFFFRMDGGSNGYERCNNEKYYYGLVTNYDTDKKTTQVPEFDSKQVQSKYWIEPSECLTKLENLELSEQPIVNFS